jgi:hypothetical protein
MFGAHPMFRIGGGQGYQITNSLRFRASNSAYLSRSFGSPTSNIKWTWSGWIKRGALGSQQIFCGGDGSSNNFFAVTCTASDTIQISQIASGAYNVQMATTAVFRDPSAWYHLVVIYDSANATSTDRIQIYVNNSRQTVSYSTGPFGASTACQWNVSSRTHYLRRLDYSALYGDMYAANETFIDGQALTPSSFGQTDATTGVWSPKSYSGTYGANGFFLQFKDAASTTTIGYDTSGNSNNWTSSGISVTSGVTFDQMLDTPTNNYCVLSQINKSTSGGTVKNAGLTWNSGGGGATFYLVQSTFVLSGKCYWEYVIPTTITYHVPGIMRADQSPPSSGGSYYPGGGLGPANSVGYRSNDGDVYVGGVAVVAGATPSAGDIIMFAFDAATGELWVGRNGTWLNSGDPAAGTGEVTTVSLSYSWVATLCDASTQDAEINFGQRAFAYTPPSGFKALNTANLSVPSIKKPSLYMDATLRTGTGATASVSSLGFQPDLVWIKSRSAATNNNLFDSARGATIGLVSQNVNAEYTDANSLTAFNSNGYSLGSDASSRGVNINTNTYVDWAWKEGATPGFDIVTYTGNGTNRTVSHALGAAPACYVVKYRSGSNADEWFMYHKALGATKYIRWSQALASSASSTYWQDTAPTSSVFSLGTNTAVNTNTSLYVAYLWSEIDGFSKFGSYTGNASSDGPFVFCGFQPRWIYIKGDNATSGRQYDTARLTNEAKSPLYFNAANAESAEANGIDILSNGFKVRWSDSVINGSGTTYIFMAFAEAPFKYARAR